LSKLFQDFQRSLLEQTTSDVAIAPELARVFEAATEGRNAEINSERSALKCERHLRLLNLALPLLPLDRESIETQAAHEAYRSLRTKLMRMQHTNSLKSIVISSCTQGEGKTISSLNLGLTFAQVPGFRVAVVDADLRTRGLSLLTGATDGVGLAEVLAGQAACESTLIATSVNQLYLIGAGTAAVRSSDAFIGDNWKSFIDWCHGIFNLVIIDSPPILGLADFELIAAPCSAALVVVHATRCKRDLLKQVKAQVDTNKVLGVVMNGLTHAVLNYPY